MLPILLALPTGLLVGSPTSAEETRPLRATATSEQAHATEEFLLFADDASAGDLLGAAVDVHDDRIVAGAPGSGGTGAAYVFAFDGTSFVQEPKLVAADGQAGDAFGQAVAIDGATAVIGAPKASPNGSSSGAAYVFVRSGTAWSQQAKLTPSNPAENDNFGSAVSVFGDTLLVGTPRLVASGSAYVFTRTGTVWSEQKELEPTAGSAGNGFGASVSMKSERCVVGAPLETGTSALSGAAFVFDRSGTTWSQTQKLMASDGQAEDNFGSGVALSGEYGQRLIEVGASGDDDGGANAGALYSFAESGGSWSEQDKRAGLGPGDAMGASVDTAWNFSLSGAALWDGGQINTGSAVMWFADSAVLAQVFLSSESTENLRLGAAVACDRCWEVGGAPGHGAQGVEAGAVFVFDLFRGSGILNNGSFVNPEAMTTQAGPNIGKPWIVHFDTSSEPTAAMTDILIYRKFLPTPVMGPWGEVLISFAPPRLLWDTELGSGTVVHSNTLPLDYSYVGLRAAAQGMIRDASGKILTLTNGELLAIGCYGQ